MTHLPAVVEVAVAAVEVVAYMLVVTVACVLVVPAVACVLVVSTVVAAITWPEDLGLRIQ
jgi:hypothetical protein